MKSINALNLELRPQPLREPCTVHKHPTQLQTRPALPKFDDKTRSDWINFQAVTVANATGELIRLHAFANRRLRLSARGSHLLESRMSFSSRCRSVALEVTSHQVPVCAQFPFRGHPAKRRHPEAGAQGTSSGRPPELHLVFTVIEIHLRSAATPGQARIETTADTFL